MERIDFLEQKLITSTNLSSLQKNRTEKLIWTNGCFDLIHAGHISYLYACKKLGGKLIVGLNSDDSVRRLKGPGRPVLGMEERSLQLASFFFVDHILVFDEDTPLKWIREIRPDILVKGGDYIVEEIIGYHEVTEYDGQVMTIPLVEGRSTTSIIERIKNTI